MVVLDTISECASLYSRSEEYGENLVLFDNPGLVLIPSNDKESVFGKGLFLETRLEPRFGPVGCKFKRGVYHITHDE